MADETTDDKATSTAARELPAIGQMNGKWAFLLKAVLITTPAAWAIFVTVDLPWRIWVTRSTFQAVDHQAHASDLSSKLDLYVSEQRRDFRELERRLDSMPPPDWQQRIQALEGWERENKADHTRIMIVLEAIKAKLDILPNMAVPNGARLHNNREHRDDSTAALGDRPVSSDPG